MPQNKTATAPIPMPSILQFLLYFRGSRETMNVYRNIEELPVFRRSVVTIGTFDGVHTGHQQIIRQLTEEAQQIDGESVIITFDPHPRKILGSTSGPVRLINTTEEKIGLLSAMGIQHLVVIPFTEAFSKLTADEYIRDFLVAQFNPHTIIIGYDHRFGQGRKGDYHMLEAFSDEFGYRMLEIPVHVLDAVSVSSTRIRHAISGGEMEVANALLGYDFFFDGTVTVGNRLGRTIGYPTANLAIGNSEKLLPGNGVYAVELELADVATTPWYKGMMNIGFRPTVGGTLLTIEVNIFNFGEDIYGRSLRVYVKKYLRGEQKFDGLDALKKQLAQDKLHAEAALWVMM